MKNIIYLLIVTFLTVACSHSRDHYLIKYYEGEFDERGVPSGYLNSRGDTIIPIGKYFYCLTDTIRDFGMVIENNTGKILGIDENGKELFEVFKYDNGPDYVESGLFRIIKNGKIGYADTEGNIRIQPKFDCAYPFKGEFANVSIDCQIEMDGEHSTWKSDSWFMINKVGEIVEK
ncbi:WG repeat-containing protein [Flagellimonas beolgyonensis]|uniref:WG repeat-containing protein n=1 Tax=Flagellimonas beolgyonensis TaxID=864064 RepID=UPI003D65C1E2